MKDERISSVEQYIEEHGSASLEDLSSHFNVSVQTMRRDIASLCAQGVIEKVYGGVVWKGSPVQFTVPAAIKRDQECAEEKRAIAALAAEQVEDGQVIFLDSGTTVCRMVPFLSTRKNLTVVTHSLLVLDQLRAVPMIRTIVLGGELDHSANCMIPDTVNYQFDQAFVATVGIDVEGCTNTNLSEARIKSYVLGHSQRGWILADHRKYVSRGCRRFACWKDISGVITDGAGADWLDRLSKEQNLKILRADVRKSI